MSVQSVSSVVASTELASGRKRATAGESGQGGEVFALPAEGERSTADAAPRAGVDVDLLVAGKGARAVAEQAAKIAGVGKVLLGAQGAGMLGRFHADQEKNGHKGKG